MMPKYTGLKYKDGKDVTDGDILYIYNGSGEPSYYYIKYCDTDCAFKLIGKMFGREHIGKLTKYVHTDDMKFIGNIHQNPEFMEITS